MRNSADYFRPIPRRHGFEEIKDIDMLRRTKETLTLLDSSARESHPFMSSVTSATFPLCASKLVNAECVIILARLTAGLKRTLRNQKRTSRSFYLEEDEWSRIEIVLFFSLSFFFPFLFLVLQPRILLISFLLHGNNESYTKLRNLRKLSSFPWYYLDRWWFFGRKKFILTRILTFLVAFW